MTTHRSASINLRQSIGLFVLGCALLLGFSTLVNLIVNTGFVIFGVNDLGHPFAIVGIIVAVVIFIYITGCLFGFSLYLLNDPKGYDWKELRKFRP